MNVEHQHFISFLPATLISALILSHTPSSSPLQLHAVASRPPNTTL